MGGSLLGQLNCFSKKNKQKKHPKRHESNGGGGDGESSDAQTDYSLSLFGSNSSSPTGRGNSASHNNNASDAMNRNPYNHDDDTITMDPDYKQIKSGADSISNASGAVGTVDQSLTNFSANTDIFGTVSPSPFGAAPFGVAAAALSSSSSPNIAIDGSDPYSGMEMEYNPSGNNPSASSSSPSSSSASRLIQSPVPHRQPEELLEIYAPPGKLGLVIDRTEYRSTSVLSLGESWVSPGRVTDLGNSRSTTISTRHRTSIPLKDVIDGSLQWYAGATTSATSNTVSQSAIDRKLRNAAERFMKFQSGYFSPMMPNDNNVELNRMNNMNNGYYSNGYNENGYNNGYNNNNAYNNDYNNRVNNGYNNGFNDYDTYDTSSILAEDFVFRSPVVGPLTKWDYIDSLDYFRVYEAFPDINSNCYGFTVDAVDPMKVRFFVKATGTYQNPLGGFVGSTAAKLNPPDGRQYMGSTEAWSITFNDLDRMQVKSISAGYVVDRFEEDLLCTTDGKGLIFGILNTIGLSVPSKPGSKSLELTQWLTGQFAKKGGKDALFPKTNSKTNTIPQWWSDKRLGAKE